MRTWILGVVVVAAVVGSGGRVDSQFMQKTPSGVVQIQHGVQFTPLGLSQLPATSFTFHHQEAPRVFTQQQNLATRGIFSLQQQQKQQQQQQQQYIPMLSTRTQQRLGEQQMRGQQQFLRDAMMNQFSQRQQDFLQPQQQDLFSRFQQENRRMQFSQPSQESRPQQFSQRKPMFSQSKQDMFSSQRQQQSSPQFTQRQQDTFSRRQQENQPQFTQRQQESRTRFTQPQQETFSQREQSHLDVSERRQTTSPFQTQQNTDSGVTKRVLDQAMTRSNIQTTQMQEISGHIESATGSQVLGVFRPFYIPRSATLAEGHVSPTFSCSRYGQGYYADPDSSCRMFHVCSPVRSVSGGDLNNSHYRFTFRCGEGEKFDQTTLTCTLSATSTTNTCPSSPSSSLYTSSKSMSRGLFSDFPSRALRQNTGVCYLARDYIITGVRRK
ncbi:hypothetical protein Pcinc_034416 [Petrolisthes cinctipes]|uniref:Chitin-binding type-2 domain-containing protein n=1 Tax=Petrolisthes cinctipes TaxID=88211 RepID=A0AAE1JZ84_PETCI|nr:hypothetical protein Pcinc_034416 [Petrolisthes cinctipes]